MKQYRLKISKIDGEYHKSEDDMYVSQCELQSLENEDLFDGKICLCKTHDGIFMWRIRVSGGVIYNNRVFSCTSNYHAGKCDLTSSAKVGDVVSLDLVFYSRKIKPKSYKLITEDVILNEAI